MNIAEEKWPIQQQPPAQPQTPQPQAPGQVPHSPHHPHNMTGMPQDNFMQTYQYDGQPPQGAGMHPSTMPVHDANHTMYMPQPKQEMDTPSRQQFQRFVPMPTNAPQNPGQPAGSPGAPTTPVAPTDRKVMDGRPTFATSSFHAAQYPGPVRKRRADALGYPVDAGPFFSTTKQHQNLYSMDRTQSYKLRINSKVDRGFFLADSDWTCYRRNYFQISSAFSITTPSGHPVPEAETPCLVEIDGQFHSVSQFLLGITARVSNSDKKIDLVQHTPKRDKGPQSVPVPKPIRAGGNLNLSSVGSNSNIVTFERIQFKTATANNGKRRAAQQYYVILVDLYAQVENLEQFKVATSTSAPLVVRGRSPGHYADNHDRYNPLASMNPVFNDRHLTFPPHPSGHGGAPGVMSGDFGGAPFPPYGQYPFTSFNPVNQSPVRNDTLSLIMTSTQNTPTPSFPQHHPQPYMVPSISEVSSAESTNPDMYNTPNLDPNNLVNGQDQKISPISPQHHHHQQQVGMEMHGMEASGAQKPPFMKIEIPQSSELPEHPLTSPAYHSQEYVEGYMYHNGHPATNASAHHGGYHSDSEHRPNGYQRESNSQQPRSDGQPPQGPHNSSPQMNGESKTGVNGPAAGSGANANAPGSSPQHSWGEHHGSKSPPPASGSSPSTTTPTSELGKNLGQLNMNYRNETADKI